jgi:catechol 2,3-dioxygenase-like lactoylglutathione lyase family enzyme
MNLNQVTIPSRDLSISVPFYQKLGLELIVNAAPHYVRFVCPDGDSTFSIHRAEQITAGEGIYLYFELEDVDEKVQDLQRQGITFFQAPQDQSWLWREARLRDPDGHTLILYHAGENRKNPPWRLSPA